MNTPRDPDNNPENPEKSHLQRPLALYAAIAILAIEGLVAVGVLLWYLYTLFTGDYAVLDSILVQIVLAILMAGWIFGTAIGMFAAKNMAKASAIVLQILFVALAVTFIQYGAEGWLLYGSIGALVLAAAAFVLIFTSKVTRFFVDEGAVGSVAE